MSSLTVLFSFLLGQFRRLMAGPAFFMRTSAMITYLLEAKEKSHYERLFKNLKILQYVYLGTFALRMVTLNVYLLRDGATLQAYLSVDPFLSSVALKLFILNKYTVGIVGLMFLYALYLDYLITFQVDYLQLKVAYEIVVENVGQCSTTGYGHIGRLSPHSRRLWAALRQLHQQPQLVSFNGGHLESFPRLSKELRIHLVRVAIYSETLVYGYNLGVGVVFLGIWTLQLSVLLELVQPVALPFAILDLTLTVYCTFNAIRMAIFSLHTNYIFSCLFGAHLKQALASLTLTVQTKQVMQSKVNPHEGALITQLHRFHCLHTRIYLFEESLDRVLVGPLMCVTVTINVLVNAVVLNFLLMGRTVNLEKAFILLMSFFQASHVLLAFQICLSLVAPLYTCERLLYRAQGSLAISRKDEDGLSAKLHLLTFFELVCTKAQFTFSIGSMGSISKNTVFEFFFAYSGFFLYITKLLRKLSVGM